MPGGHGLWVQGRDRVVPVEEDVAQVYVWELPVRVCHWAIVASLAVLTVTGLYMGTPFLLAPGEAGEHFIMGTMKVVHFYAGIVFTLAVLARIAWMFLGNRFARWDKFLPVAERRRKALAGTLGFYLFRFRRPPGFVGHNPLAGLAYLVVYLLCLVQIATGLGLYAVSAHVGSPLGWFDVLLPLFGGAQTARWIHHVILWLLLCFAAHHVYSALLVSIVERNATMESIFSGFKFVRREDLIHSGYRYVTPRAASEESAGDDGGDD